MKPRNVIRVGVIGLRFGVQVHVPAFRANTHCVIAALAGRDAVRTKAAAEELGVPASHSGWRPLLADLEIDAVSIAVPPTEQAVIIVEAARLGKHVFCEKPVAASLAAAEEAVECVRRAGVVHAIDFIFPEIPAWQLAAKLLREGAIGAPLHFSYTWRVETFASRFRTDSWKTRSRDGGGAIGNFLSHVIFNIGWLLGEPVGIDCVPRRNAVSASFCDCVVHLAKGIHGSVSISTEAFLGGGHQIEIFGESGTLVLRNVTKDYAAGFEVLMGTRAGGRLNVIPHEQEILDSADGRIAATTHIAGRFLDAIHESTSVTPNLEHGVSVQRWLERMTHVD